VAQPVVQGFPTADEFVAKIVREMRIRFYQPHSIKNYRNALRSFLNWYGGPPHRVTREDVREYLLYLVDAQLSSSTVSSHLSAIRTAFDKMCRRQVTLGLTTPRRPKKLPVVLSVEEVQRLLEATPSLRDKLLLGLMYATGMRVGEVVRLRWRDFDFERRLVNVWQGKGRSDRQVMLPRTLEPLLKRLSAQFTGDDYVFPAGKASRPDRLAGRRRCHPDVAGAATGNSRRRHLSPRTVERVMHRAVRIAGIRKHATPHSLRHSFACHTYEYTCDLRKIQKILGHVRLETTTIYVKVARPVDNEEVTSPLDVLCKKRAAGSASRPPAKPSVGRLRIHVQPEPSRAADALAPSPLPAQRSSGGEGRVRGGIFSPAARPHDRPGSRQAKVTLEIPTDTRPVYLTGIVAREIRRGWVNLEIPPWENWDEPLRRLSPPQRQRIEEPEFYELLQREIPRRLLRMPTS
jgi:site-specific recombinase XerD